MAYTKLDSGITESTIWQAPDTTRLVWIAMLARADQNGYVGASMPGLAGLARVSLEACIAAIATLEAPDQWSRTKDHEGRRIAPADGGWVLLNHAKYRAMQNADDRRERSRLAMAALRNKRKQASQPPTVSTGEQSYGKLTQAEAEAEAGKKRPRERVRSAEPTEPGPLKAKDLEAEGVAPQTAADWLTLRKAKRLPLTVTAWADTKAEGAKAGLDPAATVAAAVAHNWAGFRASWFAKDVPGPPNGRRDIFSGLEQ